MELEETINNLQEYIDLDRKMRTSPIEEWSDFDKFCELHCRHIEQILHYIKEESIPRAAIEEKIKWCKEIADNGANAVRFAMTHEDEIERIEKQKNLSTFIDILQELLNKGE